MARARYAIAAMLTILIGLLVHLHGGALGPVAQDVLGDALWAAMILWLVSALQPGARLVTRAGVAYVICVAVEFSQRWHAPLLDATRATRLGHLMLGSGFDARDLLSYALGILAAAAIVYAGTRRTPHPSATHGNQA